MKRIYQPWSNETGFPTYAERRNSFVEILREMNEDECGKVYWIRFEDGLESSAWEDDLIPIQDDFEI